MRTARTRSWVFFRCELRFAAFASSVICISVRAVKSFCFCLSTARKSSATAWSITRANSKGRNFCNTVSFRRFFADTKFPSLKLHSLCTNWTRGKRSDCAGETQIGQIIAALNFTHCIQSEVTIPRRMLFQLPENPRIPPMSLLFPRKHERADSKTCFPTQKSLSCVHTKVVPVETVPFSDRKVN